MKILLSAIPFDNGKSGISVYIREVVKALESQGHELTLIVEDDGAEEFKQFDLIRIKKRRALFSMLYSLFILPWRINWKKFDFCIMLAANRRVFCRYPIFTIAVVHDLSQYHVPVKYDKFRMLYIKRILPHYVRKAQHIAAISHSTKRDLIQRQFSQFIYQRLITCVIKGRARTMLANLCYNKVCNITSPKGCSMQSITQLIILSDSASVVKVQPCWRIARSFILSRPAYT